MQKTSLIFLMAIFLTISSVISVGSQVDEENPLHKKITRSHQALVKKAKKIEDRKAKTNDYLRAKNLNLGDDICKKDVLEFFGMTGDFHNVLVASSHEKRYCRKNELTCCTAENIKSIEKTFKEGVSNLTRRIDMLEELMSLFKGDAFSKTIDKIKKEEKTYCNYVFGSQENRLAFVSQSHLEEQMDNFATLLVDLEVYTKQQKWFYGNFVCSICDPFNHQFLNLGVDASSIIIHSHTCSELFEMKDFEYRVAEIYHTFINPYINAIDCLEKRKEAKKEGKIVKKSNKPAEEENKQNIDKVEGEEEQVVEPNEDKQSRVEEGQLEDENQTISIKNIEKEIIDKLHTDIQTCYGRGHFKNDAECKELCKKNIISYKLDVDIFDKIAEALEIVFERLTGNEISEYYENVKQAEFVKKDVNEAFSFFKINNEGKNFQSDITWDIKDTEGLAIFTNHISKKFTGFASLIAASLYWMGLAVY